MDENIVLFRIRISSDKKVLSKLKDVFYEKFEIVPVFFRQIKWVHLCSKHEIKFVNLNSKTIEKILKIILKYDKIYDTMTMYCVENMEWRDWDEK